MNTKDDRHQELLAKPPAAIPAGSVPALRRQAADCRACPIGASATQVVFGAGPVKARVMLVGEQPGNEEDRQGQPFVGAAGRLLDKALEEAGLERTSVYLTNAVKHFKFERRGKIRLHKRANAAEQAACRMWLAAELDRVRPRIVVALGAMAAQAFLGPSFRITRHRGQWLQRGSSRILATWHPSAVLRARSDASRQSMYQELVRDLRQVVKASETSG